MVASSHATNAAMLRPTWVGRCASPSSLRRSTRLSCKRSSRLCGQPGSRLRWLPCASWGGSARALTGNGNFASNVPVTRHASPNGSTTRWTPTIVLVARELEHRWETALGQVSQLQEDYERLRQTELRPARSGRSRGGASPGIGPAGTLARRHDDGGGSQAPAPARHRRRHGDGAAGARGRRYPCPLEWRRENRVPGRQPRHG